MSQTPGFVRKFRLCGVYATILGQELLGTMAAIPYGQDSSTFHLSATVSQKQLPVLQSARQTSLQVGKRCSFTARCLGLKAVNEVQTNLTAFFCSSTRGQSTAIACTYHFQVARVQKLTGSSGMGGGKGTPSTSIFQRLHWRRERRKSALWQSSATEASGPQVRARNTSPFSSTRKAAGSSLQDCPTQPTVAAFPCRKHI